MKILAIDTSSKTCGVCILENKKEVYKKDIITDRSHSIKLMPIIEEVFNNVEFELKDIDLIVCDKGPGSFTGIRIGVATAKAFCDSLDIPLIGVSSLESLAYRYLNENKLVCPILNAKNDNCYFALYKCGDNSCKKIVGPFSASLEDALKILEVFKNKILELIPTAEFSEDILINSYNLGLAGYTKYTNNDFEDSLPMYLKKPQAERQLEEKLNGNRNS